MQDIWTWDGSTWAAVHPSTLPPPTVGALLAYDDADGRVVMVLDAPAGDLQTWSWDGRAWTQLLPSRIPPAPRFGGAMAYDAARRQIVLFGQMIAIVGPQAGQTDTTTWTFDGTTWTGHASADSPKGLEFAGMAYDEATSTVVHFGGDNASDFFNDTWTWNGGSWSHVSASASPGKRSAPVTAYDAADRELVLYGGAVQTQNSLTTFYDTWTWDGSTWTLRQAAASAS